MTIEIKQLIVRAVVQADPESLPAKSQQRSSAQERPASAHKTTSPPYNRRGLIAACVREVLRELERSRER